MIRKTKEVIKNQMTQGVTPRGLAMTCALAFIMGTFPVLGTTTLLCFLAAVLLKLNQPLIQVLNYILYPLQILLIPIFLKVGQLVFNSPPLTIDPRELVKQFSENWLLFLERYGQAGLQAIVVWAVVTPILGILIFWIVKPILEKSKLKAS